MGAAIVTEAGYENAIVILVVWALVLVLRPLARSGTGAPTVEMASLPPLVEDSSIVGVP